MTEKVSQVLAHMRAAEGDFHNLIRQEFVFEFVGGCWSQTSENRHPFRRQDFVEFRLKVIKVTFTPVSRQNFFTIHNF